MRVFVRTDKGAIAKFDFSVTDVPEGESWSSKQIIDWVKAQAPEAKTVLLETK